MQTSIPTCALQAQYVRDQHSCRIMWSDANFGLHHTHSLIYPLCIQSSSCSCAFVCLDRSKSIAFVCLDGSKSIWCFLLSTAFIVIVIAVCARSSTHLIVDCTVSHSDPQSILPVFSKVAPTLLETCQINSLETRNASLQYLYRIVPDRTTCCPMSTYSPKLLLCCQRRLLELFIGPPRTS